LSLNDDLAKYKEDSFMQRLKSFMVYLIFIFKYFNHISIIHSEFFDHQKL